MYDGQVHFKGLNSFLITFSYFMQTAVTLGRDHLFIRNAFANNTGFNRINPVLDTLSGISGPVFS